jgi:hypothetical protein
MRLNFFSRNRTPDAAPQESSPARPKTGKTFPADEVVWGIAVRNGFDELDDPWYHRGLTQHAYLERSDNASICGFRPPQSGPRTRRRARLALPTAGQHPMCGMCARMVVAPRPRVPVPVQAGAPVVAVPVRPDAPRPAPAPVGVAPRAAVSASAEAKPSNGTVPVPKTPTPTPGPTPAPVPAPVAVAVDSTAPPGGAATSPWVKRIEGHEPERGTISIEDLEMSSGGLMARGVHTEFEG